MFTSGLFSFFSEYLCHVYVRNDNLAAVAIADSEYPQRVCFTLLDKVRETVTPSILSTAFQFIKSVPSLLVFSGIR